MNLYNKTVYRIDLVDPANPQHLRQQICKYEDNFAWTVPSPGCVNGQHRPFGLEFARGNLFVGLVCSVVSGRCLQQDLGPISTKSGILHSGDVFHCSVFLWIMTRAGHLILVISGNREANQGWFPQDGCRRDVSAVLLFVTSQPILCDIVFDVDGSLIMRFL